MELLGGCDYSLAELCEDALLEMTYKEAHVKPAVDRLLAQHRVVRVRTGRSYADRVFRLAAEQTVLGHLTETQIAEVPDPT